MSVSATRAHQERPEPGDEAAPTSRVRAGWAPAAALILAFAVLLPVLHSSLRFDDRGALALRELMRLTGSSLGEQIWSDVHSMVFDQRRLQPLGAIQSNVIRYALPETPSYKALLVVLTLIVLVMLYRLVRRLELPVWAGALVVVATAGALQFRVYHDSLLGYYGTVQVLLILLLGSLLALHAYVTGGRRRWFAVSVLLFTMSLLTYEIAPPLAAVPIAMIAGLVGIRRHALILAAPYAALAAIWIFVLWWARQGGAVPEGYGADLNPLAAVKTYLVQLLGPIPGIYLALDPQQIRPQPTRAELVAAGWRTVLFAAITGWLLVRYAPVSRARWQPLVTLALIGLAFWLSPPVLVALAPKYQEEIRPGMAYLPVLAQYLGWGLVVGTAAIACVWLAARRGMRIARVAALGITALLTVSAAAVFYANERVVAIDGPTTAVRSLLRDSLRHHVLWDLPEGAGLLLHMRDMAWPRQGFAGGDWALDGEVSMVGGVLYDVRIAPPPERFDCPSTSEILGRPDCAPLGEAQWLMVRPRIGAGTAIAVRLKPPYEGRALTAPATALRVYSEGLSGPPELSGTDRRGRPWSSRGLRWRQTDEGDGWAVYEASVAGPRAPVAASLDDPAGRVDFRVAYSPGETVRRLGTRWLLP